MDTLKNTDDIEETQIKEFTQWENESVAQNKSLILEFIKQLRPGVELWRMALPAFILENRSMLEKISDYCYPSSLIENVSTAATPEDRMIEAVKFLVSAIRWTPRKKGVAKPYNPVVGELFTCSWTDRNGNESRFLAEQVSHHPPISAFYMESPANNIVIDGYINPKSTFYGNTAWTTMSGTFEMHVLNHEETYVYEVPPIVVRGIMFGQIMMEFNSKGRIVCKKTGHKATVDFHSKKDNAIDGKIKKHGNVIYTLNGKLHEKVTYKTKERRAEAKLLYDTTQIQHSIMKTRKVDKQDENESRVVWRDVTESLDSGEFDRATSRKSEIEEEQRQKRKESEAAGKVFQPKYFEWVELEGLKEGGRWMYKNSIVPKHFFTALVDSDNVESDDE